MKTTATKKSVKKRPAKQVKVEAWVNRVRQEAARIQRDMAKLLQFKCSCSVSKQQEALLNMQWWAMAAYLRVLEARLQQHEHEKFESESQIWK